MLVCTNKETEEEGVVISGRSSMHVQSVSEWAPANIGPYSQAYTVSNVTVLPRTYTVPRKLCPCPRAQSDFQKL